jgi:hypothetical protein
VRFLYPLHAFLWINDRKVLDDSETAFARLGDVHVRASVNMPNAVKVQAGYKAQPLSAFLKQSPPPAAAKIDFVPAATAGINDNCYEYLDAALQYVPESPGSKEIRASLTRIGIGPGKTFEFEDLSLEH